ncbi:hypothetical protein [Sinimarinibacterium flocculans]|uniref:Secreted protein n=1 Tax=Sinimarinibacterium flocculans TaxID=985250 RepID=A0A318EEK7_9GAMM|nr:hypothetical protein [Sinimarinibacterium flocculans]PXV71243.1 hypothetical protein C8D93_101288 [Sinimarinibacterium flocculans]
MRRLRCSACLWLLLTVGAHAQPAQEAPEQTELEPIIVEAERDPLDVIGVHRERLPCIGECEDEDDEADGLSRFWRGLVRLSIYGPPEEKPEPVRSLEVVNPIKARLDDKQP